MPYIWIYYIPYNILYIASNFTQKKTTKKLGGSFNIFKTMNVKFLILLKACIALHTNQKCTWKIRFHGTHTHRNTKSHFVWPCGILTKWPWKEYEEIVWEEEHECREKLFLLIFLAVQFITWELNLWSQLLIWHREAGHHYNSEGWLLHPSDY